MELGSSCALSSTVSTVFRLGSGTCAGHPFLGREWKETLEPSKIEVKRLVKDWSLKDMTGLNDEQVKDALAEIEGTMSP